MVVDQNHSGSSIFPNLFHGLELVFCQHHGAAPAVKQHVHTLEYVCFVVYAQYGQVLQFRLITRCSGRVGLFVQCLWARQGHHYGETAAISRCRANVHFVVKHSRDTVTNGQAQSQAFFIKALCVIKTVKFLENGFDLGLVDPNARIPDTDFELLAPNAAAQQNAAFFCVADGIGQEILNDPVEQFPVAVNIIFKRVHS